MKAVLIDVGSTFIKWRECDKSCVVEGKIPFPPPCIDDGFRYETNAETIVEIVKEIIDRAEADCVCISVQMHGYVIPQMSKNYVSWRDRRGLLRRDGQTYFERFEKTYAQAFSVDCGTAVKANLAPVGLYTDAQERSLHLQGTFFSLGSYIVYELTGNNISHVTDLAATGFYRTDGALNRMLTDDPLFFDLQYPIATTAFCVAGRYTNTDIFVAVGDQQAAVRSLDGYGYVLNTGTATQACLVSGERAADVYVENRPYFQNKMLCTVTGLPGGAEIEGMFARGLSALEIASAVKGRYLDALDALPDSGGNTLFLCGGTAAYRQDVFRLAFADTGLTLVFSNACALSGLEMLLREQKERI